MVIWLGQWCMTVIQALEKLRQEDCECKSSLGYMLRPRLPRLVKRMMAEGGELEGEKGGGKQKGMKARLVFP